MNIQQVFNSIPQKEKSKDNRLKDLLRVIQITDPRKVPKDLPVLRLREITEYVENSNINFEEFQIFVRKLIKIPSTVGTIGYI